MLVPAPTQSRAQDSTSTVDTSTVDSSIADVSGAFKKWHPVTVALEGPQASENDDANPFLDYRFQVVFSQGSRAFTVPGYFAADGNAAETSAEAGAIWRAHFVPDSSGMWEYEISIRTGENIAVDENPLAGIPVAGDGLQGSFFIEDISPDSLALESDTSVTRDHRQKGMLRYNGSHYLQFDNGEYFLKGGANSPENFLAYVDFDSTYNAGGLDFTKTYADHIVDWRAGDPLWKDDKGKGIIGGLNYLSSKGMNVLYFLTMNVQGDGYDVWPWTSPDARLRYDVSKLDQWDIVFSHMDSLGMMLHVVLQETENDLLLDAGNLGLERKLYYRELIARFGHHHALTWNIGEENDDNTDAQRKAFASYIRAMDPYDHPIVVHTFPGQYDDIYEPLLGYEDFEGPSLQINQVEDVHDETLLWRRLSEEAGRPWVVSLDETGPYTDGVLEEGPANNFDNVRKLALWPHLMAGGAGVEWYFGYDSNNHDLSAQTWRTRDAMWDYTRHALTFFQTHLPFYEMTPADELSASETDYVFADTGRVYAVYSPAGDSIQLEIPSGEYTVQWYNPRTGGALFSMAQDTLSDAGQDSIQMNVATGPTLLSVGTPAAGEDWVLLVDRLGEPDPAPDPVDDGTPAITMLLLMDADADSVIAPLSDQTLDLAKLPPHLNVVAEIRNSAGNQIAYIELHVTPPYVIRKETIAPYALFGDIAGNYIPGTFTTGENTVIASPWYYQEGALVEGKPLSFTFEVTGFNPETNIRVQAPAFEMALERDKLQVEDLESDTAFTFALEGNYPNPFNPTTVIAFSIPETQAVQLIVYDILGREVKVLVDGEMPAGHHEVVFDAASLPAGAYLYKLDAGEQSRTRKMLLIK